MGILKLAEEIHRAKDRMRSHARLFFTPAETSLGDAIDKELGSIRAEMVRLRAKLDRAYTGDHGE